MIKTKLTISLTLITLFLAQAPAFSQNPAPAAQKQNAQTNKKKKVKKLPNHPERKDTTPPTSVADIGNDEDANIKTPEQIIKPLEMPIKSTTTAEKNFMETIAEHVVIPLDKGPLLLLPVVDSSKDLGPNYGIMPIWALRDTKRQVIGSVMAPSINYNKYLLTTYTYRHYVFPDDKQLWVLRGSYSTKVQREIFLRYFNPEFTDHNFRINAEARHWINGKASYYGNGPKTSEGDQASYALNMTGEEVTFNLPLPVNFYIEFNQSFYRYKTQTGPVVTIPQLENKYPDEYAATSQYKDIMSGRLAILFDDTDHPVIPKLGTYGSLSMTGSKRGMGSDYSFITYTAETEHYFNNKREGTNITAMHAIYQFQTGDNLPFYAMPTLGESTGLRSVGDGRYVDRGKIAFNVEQRFTVSRVPILKFLGEIELTPFIDTGTVFHENSQIQLSDFQIGYGGAFRIVLKPQVVATADFAFGREGPNVIIHVGYPF